MAASTSTSGRARSTRCWAKTGPASHLVKIIYGVLKPDAGEIRWQGRPGPDPQPGSCPQPRHRHGVPAFSLFEALTVAENIALGINDPAQRKGLRETGSSPFPQSYGLPLDPDRAVHDLSVGERQRIEIVRCLLQNPKLLIMDEPTSVLTPQEVDQLFETLRRLAGEGCAILYISHKLDGDQALCDRATILRRRQGGGGMRSRARNLQAPGRADDRRRAETGSTAERRQAGPPPAGRRRSVA